MQFFFCSILFLLDSAVLDYFLSSTLVIWTKWAYKES